MTHPLSRRAALAGAVPALAAVLVPAAAVAAVLADANQPDAGLLAMGPKLDALYAAWDAALHEHSVAETAYFEERPERPSFDQDRHIRLKGDGQRQNQRDWSDRVRAYDAEDIRLRRKYDVDALERCHENLGDDFAEALAPIAEHQATTIAGLQFKVRWAKHEDDGEITLSLFRDVLAMQG